MSPTTNSELDGQCLNFLLFILVQKTSSLTIAAIFERPPRGGHRSKDKENRYCRLIELAI